ncbi:MAG: hypothetical protein ACI4GV_07835 [Acutalibacteraceae bacterium]
MRMGNPPPGRGFGGGHRPPPPGGGFGGGHRPPPPGGGFGGGHRPPPPGGGFGGGHRPPPPPPRRGGYGYRRSSCCLGCTIPAVLIVGAVVTGVVMFVTAIF